MMRALLNRLDRIRRASRVVIARWRGVNVGHDCLLGRHIDWQLGVRGGHRGVIEVGNGARIEQGTSICAFGGRVQLGSNVFVGPNAVIYGHGGVTIGNDTLISMHCCILSSEHSISSRNDSIRARPDEVFPTRIGSDVWLGAGVTLLGGVTIGDGCVIGAGAVVTKSLPAYTIAVGVPAKIIGERPR